MCFPSKLLNQWPAGDEVLRYPNPWRTLSFKPPCLTNSSLERDGLSGLRVQTELQSFMVQDQHGDTVMRQLFRKQRMDGTWGLAIKSESSPLVTHSRHPVGLHLPKVVCSSKTAPQLGTRCSDTGAYEGHFILKPQL